MKRIPEPELMDEAAQVQAYAGADFDQPHSHFIELFNECFADALNVVDQLSPHYALDLGCGPADISRRFTRALPHYRVHAVDGAANMITMAERLNQQCGLDRRIQLFTFMINELRLPQVNYDVIFSNSLLHHLHDPADLWKAIRHYSRPGTLVFVMDLLRPGTQKQASELVDAYAADEKQILRQDFFHSLCAAYTIAEVERQLQQCAIDYCKVRQVSDRHLIVYGISQ